MTAIAPLHGLTGLRFFAAVHVVLYHLWRYDVWETPPVLERVLRAGPASVSFFFVLSGFILSYRYTDDHGAAVSLKGYARARFARLFPVHLFAFVLVTPVAMTLWRRAGDAAPPLVTHLGHGLLCLLGLQAFVPTAALAFNPPAWSLSVELFCYALFPFMLRSLPRWSNRRTLFAFGSIWLFSLALSFALSLVADEASDPAQQQVWVHVFKFHPLVRAPEFVLGMLAARLYRAGLRAPRGVRSVVVIAGLLAPVAAGLVPYALWHNAWLSPAFALLIVTVAHGEGKSTLSRLLGVRGMRVLGESSYALYLLHVPVLYWIAGLGERRTGTKVLDEPLVASTAFAGCLLVAWLAWRFIEVPLRRQLRS